MKRLQLITPLIFLCLLSACESTAEPNEDLYGTWVETQTQGEVVFRENGTVHWNGTAGSYEFINNSGWSLYGNTYNKRSYITVELPDRTFDIPSHGPDQGENRWSHLRRTFLRKGSFEFPVMPSHFERIPNKLSSVCTEAGGVWDPTKNYFDLTTLSLGAAWIEGSSNQLIYYNQWQDNNGCEENYRFDKGLNQWVNLYDLEQLPENDPLWRHWNIHPQLTYLTHSGSDQEETLISSTDGGITWKKLPVFRPPNVLSAFSVGTDIFEIKRIFSVGTDIFTVVMTYGGTELNPVCEQEELWMLDATAEQPSWELINTFDCGGGAGFLDQALVRKTDTDSYFISYDRGLTWTDWPKIPDSWGHDEWSQGYRVLNECHYYGVDGVDGYSSRYIPRCEDDSTENDHTLYWYDVDTQTWSTHSVDFANVLGVTPNRDGLYFQRGQEIHKWSPDGIETLITTLPSEVNGASVVGNALYVSTIFGLWRMDL
jgi:hypothetical protein